MDSLFTLSEPWWYFIVRAALVYLALLILIRLSGKRTVGQFTPFDLIVVLIVSEGVQNALIADDHSVVGGLIVVATLLALNWMLGFITARSRKVEALVDGRPVLLARDGEIYKDVLRRQNIAESEVREAMRRASCPHESRIGFIFMETDGSITVVPREDQHRH